MSDEKKNDLPENGVQLYNLSGNESMALADRVINHHKASDTRKRLCRYIEKIGFEEFRKELGV